VVTALQPLDWLVLGAYALVLGTTAVLVARRPRDANTYFVGERAMPVWAVALSVLATAYSAATFIGAPGDAYQGTLTYLSTNIGSVLAVLVVAWFFIPAFYRNQVVTVYDLIGSKHGTGAKMATSAAFLIGRLFASGARLYIAALPAALLVFGDNGADTAHLAIAILVIAAIGTAYTLVGGIASIIWTDVVQMVVLLGATIGALFVLWHHIPAGAAEVKAALDATAVHGEAKTTLLSWSLSPSQPFTVITACTGWLLFGIAAYGTDQDLTQRMLTCRNAVAGGRSALVAILAGLPVTALFVLIGLLLYVYYQRPELMAGATPTAPNDPNNVFLHFILHEMPTGMRGLMFAGLFAVAFSSMLSALNAMAAALLNDIYRPLVRGRDDRHYLAASRWLVVASGGALAVFACLCISWRQANHETLITFALGVMTFAYAGLLAVFFTTLFTDRGTPVTIGCALATGFALVWLLQPPVWRNVAAAYVDPGSHRAVHELVLAAPWRLLIATAVALGVCCAARRPTPAAAPAEAA
jgi:SSS family transporter